MTFRYLRVRATVAALSFVALTSVSTSCGGDVAGPSGPASLSAVTGTTPQTATAGTAVATPPAVKVVDANGQAVQGATVTFAVTAGGGVIANATATTNSNGIATIASWILGTVAGTNTLTATIGSLAPVTFTATGIAGVATQLAKTSADPQTAVVGTAVGAAPSVTVRDANGNPVAGVSVTFAVTAGGGTIASATASSSASGVATSGTWTLGTTAGPNTVSATATGIPAATFTATGAPGAVASVVVTPNPVTVVTGGTQQLASAAADQYGNAINGAPVTYSSAGPGIASVSGTGLVTGVSIGATIITVASGSVTRLVPVVVAGHPLGGTNTIIASVPGRPFGIRVSSSGTLAVTQQDLNTVTLMSATGVGTRVTAAVGADPGDVVFSPNGLVAFVSGFNDGSVKAVNAGDGTVTGTVTVGGNAYRLALSPDVTRLYVSSTIGTVYVVNPATPSVVTSSAISAGSLQGLALSVSGQILYLTSTTGRVSRLTALTLASNATNDVGGAPQDVAVTADGSEVVVANEAGWVDVLDGSSLGSKQRISTGVGRPFGLALSPDDAQIYVTSPLTGQVFVIDRTTRTVVRTINVGGTPRRVTFAADGLTAFVANEGGWVDVIK